MHSISLKDGGSQSLSTEGLLKIRVFSIGNRKTNDLQIIVDGEGVNCLNPNPSLAVVNVIPDNASITVCRTSGEDFPIDQSVRVTVEQGADALVEFPIVQVGGVPSKLLGRVIRNNDSYKFTAFGASESADQPRSVMGVSSAIRSHLTTTAVERISLMLDSGATLHPQVSEEVVNAAVTVTRGIADALGVDTIGVTTGQGAQGEFPGRDINAILSTAVREDRTRVGAELLPRSTETSTTLNIYVTATPVAGMINSDSPSLIILVGAGATAEQELYELSPDRTPRTSVIALTDELAAAVNNADGVSFNQPAARIATIFDERQETRQ